MPGDLRYFIPGNSLSGHPVRAPSRNGRPQDWSPRRRRARPIPASHAEIECGICLPDIVPARSRPGCGIGSSIPFDAFFPSAGSRFTGCRGRRRRQPVAAAHSGWHAHIAALAIAAITGEPDRSASLNSSECIHFECVATPSRALHIARALLCSPHPLAFTRVLRVGATGWPRSGQLGAFASQGRGVKNWMGRRVGIQAFSARTWRVRVGATGWSLVANWGLSLPDTEASKTGWTAESRIQAFWFSRVLLAWGQLVGHWSANRGLSLLGVEASKTGWTGGVTHPGLGGKSVLGKRCRASTTGTGDLNCTLLSSWRSAFRSNRGGAVGVHMCQ